jgi:hypothetical protein
MRPLVIYSYILQHFFNSSCRRDILRLILSWKFPGKLLCITLFFTSCLWYNIVVYFTKKMPFRVPNILGEFKGKICSECISHNPEFQNYPVENPHTREGDFSGFLPLAPAAPGSCLRHSTLPLLYKLRLLLQFFLRTLDMPICFYQIFLVSFNILFESKNELKKPNKSYLILI